MSIINRACPEGFPAPPNTDLVGYHGYIDEAIPPESPYLYGLHPNAEIGFLTTTSENLFRTVFEMQPRDAGNSGGQTVTREDKVNHSCSQMSFLKDCAFFSTLVSNPG